MKTLRIPALLIALVVWVLPAAAGDAEVQAAQRTIESQLQAFLADDDAAAYALAAPNIKMMYPTREAFMAMVRNGYPQVHRPRNYAFGKVEEPSAGRILQHVLIQGPDGKDYEALYTLELQPDGLFRITGVSLRAANTLST
jgi:hypothetical protein